MKRDAGFDALLVFSASAAFLSVLPQCFNVFDEGLVAETAARIQQGDVLYRDFFSYWNPGGFWLNAILFEIAGASVQTLRISLSLMGAVAAVGVWQLARDHCGRLLAIGAGLAIPLVCYPVWWMASSHWYSTFTAIAAAVLLRSCFREGRPSTELFMTGFLGGMTFVMLQPTGVFLCIAIAAGLAWDGILLVTRREAFARIAIFSSGALMPIVAMYGYYAYHGILGTMLYDTLLWNLEHFSPALESSYGQVFVPSSDPSFSVVRWLLMVLPPLIYLLSLGVTVSRYLRREARLEDRQLFALTVMGIGLLASNFYFPDIIHLAFGAPLAFPLLAAMIFRLQRTRAGRSLAPVVSVVFVALVAFAGSTQARNLRDECSAKVSTPRGETSANEIFAEDLRELSSFLEDRLSPGERFYVYPYGPGYNFLLGHQSPAPYMASFPKNRVLTPLDDFDRIQAALESQGVRYIVVPYQFRSELPFVFRAGTGRSNSPFENYLIERYRRVYFASQSLVLKRISPALATESGSE